MERISIALSVGADVANGRECEILYAGTFDLGDRGTLEITEAMVDEIVTNFVDTESSGRIPISVNHRTGAGTLEEARAIGWIVDLFKKTENGRISLYMKPKWLDDAKASISNEEFRFLSAGLQLRPSARLVECSITNVPALSGLQPIALSAATSKTGRLRQQITLLSHRVDLLKSGGSKNMSGNPVDEFWRLTDEALKANPSLHLSQARAQTMMAHPDLAARAGVPGARRAGRKSSAPIQNSDHYRDEFFRLAEQIETKEGCNDVVARGRVLREYLGLRDAAFGGDARTRFFGAAKYETTANKLTLDLAYKAAALHLAADAQVVL